METEKNKLKTQIKINPPHHFLRGSVSKNFLFFIIKIDNRKEVKTPNPAEALKDKFSFNLMEIVSLNLSIVGRRTRRAKKPFSGSKKKKAVKIVAKVKANQEKIS